MNWVLYRVYFYSFYVFIYNQYFYFYGNLKFLKLLKFKLKKLYKNNQFKKLWLGEFIQNK